MGLKRPAFLNVEPGAFLSLYKIAHSESMVDKWDNFAFRLLHNQRSPLRTREDIDSHTVRAAMTLGFLDFSKSHGNDFSTPVP